MDGDPIDVRKTLGAAAAHQRPLLVTGLRCGGADSVAKALSKHPSITMYGKPGTMLHVARGTRAAEVTAADAGGATLWCDVHPGFLRHADQVLRVFGAARFVHVVRDPRSCAASLVTEARPGHLPSLPAVTAEWVAAMRDSRRVARRVGPRRYLEVKYEDFVNEPEPTLRRLAAFAGCDYDPAMGKHVRPDGGERLWQALQPDELRFIEWATWRPLRRMGYEPVALLLAPPMRPLARFAKSLAGRELRTRRARLRGRLRPARAVAGAGKQPGP